MTAYRPALSRGVVAALLAVLALLVAAASAGAVTGHRLSRTIGTSSPGGLTAVAGGGVTTTRAANGDVFVVDPSASVVQEYSQAGDYVNTINLTDHVSAPSAITRDPSSGDLYIAGNDPATFGKILGRYSVATGQWKTPVNLDQPAITDSFFSVTSIAADSNGRVYVGNNDTPVVYLFKTDGTLERRIDGGTNTPLGKVGQLAVDSGDTLYVTDVGARVRKFSGANGSSTGAVGSTTDKAYGVAVDAGGNDIYVVDSPDGVRCGITRFSSANARQERFAEAACPDPSNTFAPNPFAALSVDATSDLAFLGNAATPAVERYVTYTAPTVSTNPATGVTATGATVSGAVNANSQPNTTYQFEYGIDSTYGSSTGETPVTSTGTKTATLADLQPNKLYHYRLKATNAQGSNYGQDRTFTTQAAPPTVSGEAATNITAFTATLNATVVANNQSSTAYFEYGPASGGYPSRAPATALSAGEAFDPVTLTANIDGLDAETTYHFRVVAENGAGMTTTTGTEFTTKPAPPLASPGPVSGVSGGAAQFSGTVDTQGLEGTVSFVVTATNSPFQAVTAPQYLAPADGARAVSGAISGLPAGGAFEVRTRIQTSTRTVLSEPATFSTPSAAFIPVPTPPALGSLPAAPAAPKPAAPSNRFSTSSSVKGTKATVKVKVPGRGAVSVSGSQIGSKKASPKKAGTVSVKVALSKKGRAALRKAKSKRLKVKVSVRYRPTGGSIRSATRTLTFRR